MITRPPTRWDGVSRQQCHRRRSDAVIDRDVVADLRGLLRSTPVVVDGASTMTALGWIYHTDPGCGGVLRGNLARCHTTSGREGWPRRAPGGRKATSGAVRGAGPRSEAARMSPAWPSAWLGQPRQKQFLWDVLRLSFAESRGASRRYASGAVPAAKAGLTTACGGARGDAGQLKPISSGYRRALKRVFVTDSMISSTRSD